MEWEFSRLITLLLGVGRAAFSNFDFRVATFRFRRRIRVAGWTVGIDRCWTSEVGATFLQAEFLRLGSVDPSPHVHAQRNPSTKQAQFARVLILFPLPFFAPVVRFCDVLVVKPLFWDFAVKQGKDFCHELRRE